MFSNSELLDSKIKMKKRDKYYIILKFIALCWLKIKTMVEYTSWICIRKLDKWIFSNSEPLHNENEKRAIILQFIVIWWLRNLDCGGVCKSNIS